MAAPVLIQPTTIALKLREWQKIGPEDNRALAGYSFQEPAVQATARQLTQSGMLDVVELVQGLEIRTNQYVGSIQMGDLRLTILPKINGMPLLNLLRYAYGFRQLDFFTPLELGTESGLFQDLLIQQLAAEARELLERGLHRRYERVDENLASPRGRINFADLSRQGGLVTASLPCTHFVRIENNLLNQCLLAGLLMASRLTDDLALRSHLRQSARILGQSVHTVPLAVHLLEKAQSSIDRQTQAYQPALQIIQILLESQGISLENDTQRVQVPGFLFDMNRFFQALLDRFLTDNLEDYTLRSEHKLRKMLSYHPEHNPHFKKSPTPRPDFAILQGKKVIALLDAKYRDLGQTELPREMLYQLALYAFSQDRPGKSTILYPTLDVMTSESWVEIAHPLSGERLARVILRPVNLHRLEALIRAGTTRERAEFAMWLAFGKLPL